eukprot:TRINITY_DN2255_c0_g1_i3.p1 TRINITY_DN2255_c0_g1~~TRINITY_DN2255_c0_g1_i3.p1  ORF type:complete len:122 (+),score=26.73 TRINITY_DN2255_c0_g1_i3:81-446(+)
MCIRDRMENFANVVKDDTKIPVSVPPNCKETEIEIGITETIKVPLQVYEIMKEGLLRAKSMGKDYNQVLPSVELVLRVKNEEIVARGFEVKKAPLIAVKVKIKKEGNVAELIERFKGAALK